MKPSTPRTEVSPSTQLRKAVFGGCLYILAASAAYGATTLRVSSNGHYIETTIGIPFLYLNDTEWLLNRHSDTEIDTLLNDRRKKGFTVIKIGIMGLNTGYKTYDRPTTDYNGKYPMDNNIVTQLNVDYWNRLLWIADQCAARSLYLELTIGGPGRQEAGKPYCHNNAECYEYGRQVGQKFSGKTNIIFNIGQDMPASEGVGLDGWRAIAEGVADGVNGVNSYNQSADYSTSFMLFHPGGNSPYTSSGSFPNEGWLDAHCIEVYHDYAQIYGVVNGDYNRSNPVKPAVMLEGSYEMDPNNASGIPVSPHHVRVEAWHTYFAGGFYGYGHYDNYSQFASFSYMSATGSRQISVLSTFMKAREWWKFVPDQGMIASSVGSGAARIAAVKSTDGDECYAYYPGVTTVGINMNRITTSSSVNAIWFDPRNGNTQTAGTYTTSQTVILSPPEGWEDAVLCLNAVDAEKPAPAPLKQHAGNWRYFDDGSGKPVYLVSSHTWMADLGSPGWPQGDWDANKLNKYLDFTQYWNLNFIRTWMWEHDTGAEGIWVKNAQGKSDLNQLNQAYFDRLYTFVREAEKRHIYVGVMLFQGFSGAISLKTLNATTWKNWELHPMNATNNVNGINGDPTWKGYGIEIHNVENTAILPYWEAYVKKMVDTFNDCNNVIWEMGNEDPYPPFSKHFIDVIHTYEKTKPIQHLLWYSGGAWTGNANIYLSNADVYGPEDSDDWGTTNAVYFKNPPVISHQKPEILDSDHLGNHTTPVTFAALDQRNWTWKSFLRGYHPLFMDFYDRADYSNVPPTANHPIAGVSTSPLWDPQRKSLGNTLRFANKMKDLAATQPTADTNLCSTGYCLYSSGSEYVAYQPAVSGSITLELVAGSYNVETFDTDDSSTETTRISDWAGGKRTFAKPVHANQDWVLYVVR